MPCMPDLKRFMFWNRSVGQPLAHNCGTAAAVGTTRGFEGECLLVIDEWVQAMIGQPQESIPVPFMDPFAPALFLGPSAGNADQWLYMVLHNRDLHRS